MMKSFAVIAALAATASATVLYSEDFSGEPATALAPAAPAER